MQRKAVVLPGIAAVLAVLVSGCSAGSGGDDLLADSKPGSTAVAAPPGKYRSLPEPCRSVGPKRLKEMLPASPALTTEQVEQLYAGKADPSYDADRRVGCRWKSETSDAARLLYVGYERVVSYEPAVSDDDRAEQVYERQLTAAGVPATPATALPTPSRTPSATASPSGGAASPPPAAASASGAPSGSATPVLGSRVLDDLADSAFLDDKLGAAGPTAKARTVRIVFRTSNVIVTVEYTVQSAQPGVVPDGEETQARALELATGLAERIGG
ncbi:DUF3558 domain-containing protein [Streptomyces bambusae]|uniref:DUF3558 domain-containing protein n=1 Tax=Streptomyces bambusae TaxID=1550616 RepID=UPI001CFF9D16|nr:DUF3558 domain-containing protein [Streptomyces bambusae]MCB5169236.1 DUF3558 domain-containing protein [Streptomyces bambusae]